MKPINENGKSASEKAELCPFNYDKIKNWNFEPLTESYTQADVVEYARGIGVGMDADNSDDEDLFLTPGKDLQALPMMAIVLNQGAMWTQDPRTGIDWTKTVHAEESVTLHGVLPNEGCLVADYGVDEIYDKGAGKGALMYEHRHLSLPDGTPLATVNIATFLRANGGCGGSRELAPKALKVPADRAPDAVLDMPTPGSDNKTYQLGREFLGAVDSRLLDSDKPMLRGVCSFGLAGRAVLKMACENKPTRLKHLGLRYTAPVFAGETLRTELWFLEPGKAAFQVSSIEREVLVMDNGVAEYEVTDG